MVDMRITQSEYPVRPPSESSATVPSYSPPPTIYYRQPSRAYPTGRRPTPRDFHSLDRVGSSTSASTDDPVKISGAPCSIQVFTSAMRDEECLQVAKLVDECLTKAVSTLPGSTQASSS